jgi:ABC-2 type transport system permease protein
MTTMTAPAPTGLPPRVNGMRATLLREYRLLTRNHTNLLLAVAPTAVYLLLFATSLSNLVQTVGYHGGTVSYQNFALPAVMLSSMIAAATTTGTSLFQEELGGMAVELWSYPLRRGSYILGKLLATTGLVLAQSLAALVVGALVFRVDWSAGQWGALLLATVVASFAFNGGYLLLATLVHDFQRFMVLINVVGPVMLFASPSFYPVDRMAAPVRWLSVANPVTYGIRCLRDSALLGLSASWGWMLLMLAMAAACAGLTSRTLLRRARRM